MSRPKIAIRIDELALAPGVDAREIAKVTAAAISRRAQLAQGSQAAIAEAIAGAIRGSAGHSRGPAVGPSRTRGTGA